MSYQTGFHQTWPISEALMIHERWRKSIASMPKLVSLFMLPTTGHQWHHSFFFEKFRDVFFFFRVDVSKHVLLIFIAYSWTCWRRQPCCRLDYISLTNCGGRKSLEAAELWVVMLRELCGAQSLLATRLNPGKTQCMMVPLETSTGIFSDYSIVSMEIHLQCGVILFEKTGVPSSST